MSGPAVGRARVLRAAVVAGLLVAVAYVAPTDVTGAPGFQATPAIVARQAYSGFSRPVYVAHAGDGTDRLFVVEKGGAIKVIVGGQVQATAFLDITALVQSGGSEQGLLGLAFHPGFSSNRRFFVYYTATSGNQRVVRYTVPSGTPNRADPGTAKTILDMADFASNHNGGMLEFRPGERYLYVATGDGGGGGDPEENGQDLGTLLGKILRIDIDPSDDSVPYLIPSGTGRDRNPFVGQSGRRGEIWVYGLRNPWRFSFDRTTRDLYIADVGQNAWEEVSRQAAGSAGGENYGWDVMEGNNCHEPATDCDRSGLIPPIHDYASNSPHCSVTGGYVYRGQRIPELQGAYVFGDYCSGVIWSLRQSGSSWTRTQLLDTPLQISSFGEDRDGELYVADYSGGGIYRLEPATPGPTPTPTPTVSTKANLVITAFSASPTSADQPIPVSVTVANQGGASSGVAFHVHVYADVQPPTDAPVPLHLYPPILGPGQSATLTDSIPGGTLSAGAHTLWAWADGHGQVDESNTGDNTRSTPITLSAPVACSPGEYRAEYFPNRTLAAPAVLTRCEAAINYQWGTGGPGSGVPVDDFSARWTGRFDFAAGSHTFIARTDDGMRVSVDGVEIISAWVDQSAREYRATRDLTAGPHDVEVEYYERGGTAVAEVRWERAAGTPTATPTHTPTRTPTPVASTPTRTPTPAPGSGGVFQEQGGQVVIEAERFSANVPRNGSSWVLRTSPSGYAGDGAMRAEPDQGISINTGYVTGSPELRYRVGFATTGTYHVWVRVSAPNGSGDSLHVGLDGQAVASADRIEVGPNNAWTWTKDTRDGAVATLNVGSTGEHTINVWMREDGLRLDRILLTRSSSFIPSGTGPAESPRS